MVSLSRDCETFDFLYNMDSAFSTLPHSIHKTPKHYKIRVFQKRQKNMHFVLYLGGPEELDKKSSVSEELRPSAIQKHLIFRPTLQDPQDIEQKSQRLPKSQILGPVPLVPSGPKKAKKYAFCSLSWGS